MWIWKTLLKCEVSITEREEPEKEKRNREYRIWRKMKFIFLNTILNITLMEVSTSIYTQSKEGRKDSGESCNRFTRALTNSHTCTVCNKLSHEPAKTNQHQRLKYIPCKTATFLFNSIHFDLNQNDTVPFNEKRWCFVYFFLCVFL